MTAGWRGRKILLGAATVCIALALVASGLVVHVDQTTAPEQVDPRPLGIGDSGTYAFFEDGEPLGALMFQVDPIQETAASQGQERTLVLHAASERSSLVLTDHASMANGNVVRREINHASQGFEGVKTRLAESEPAIPHLRLTREPIGNEDAPMTAPPGLTWWHPDHAGVAMTNLDVVRQCEVFAYAEGSGSGFVDDRGVVGLSTTLDCGAGLMNRTAWIADDWPVPALITFSGPHGNLVMGLVDFRHGSGARLTLEGTPGDSSSVEKSPPGSAHPTTGGADLAYPMEEALADVEESLELINFQIWRLIHPGSELVGARLMRGEHHWTERPTDRWIFLYATQQGQAYQAGTERARTTQEWWVTDAGSRTVGTLEGAPLEQYVSLAGAATSWQRVASEPYQDSEFNFVQWGLEPEITWSQDCEFIPEATGLLPVIGRRDQIVVGHSTYGSCTDPKIVKSESYATLGAGTGNALEVAEHRIQLPEYPDHDFPRARSFSFSATSSAMAFEEPGLQLVAAIAVPLLLLLWTLYFWPTFHFLLARAMPLLSGYSRILEGDPLRNAVRASMFDTIKADPGVTASELAQRLGIGWGSLAHHSSLLCKEGLIVVDMHGRYRHFFPHNIPRGRRSAIALLRSPKTRHTLDTVKAHPGISQQSLAGVLGITPAGVLWHVKRLQDAGLLRRERQGRRVCYHAEASA